MSPLPTMVPCAACGSRIEGASIWESRHQVLGSTRAYHPWCWHARERAVSHPGLDAIAHDLTQRERAPLEA